MRGFTVIELVIVTVIVAVLAMVAFPSYQDSVRKSRRQEALQALQTIQLAQERWRANHPAYGSLSDLAIAATTPSGFYTLTITLPSAPANQTQYTATATAVAGKSQVKDVAPNKTSCATLSVSQDAPIYSPAGQSACWSK